MKSFNFLEAACLCVLLLGVAALSNATPYSNCWDGDSDCSYTCKWDEFSQTSHLWLKSHQEIKKTMEQAQSIMKNYSPGEITSFDVPTEFHTSINYFCCHTLLKFGEIVEIMKKHEWYAFNITYEGYTCNIDHNNKTIYVTTRMTNESERAMFNWIRGVEQAIADAGIEIKNPRHQDFHSTLARVTHAYPTNQVVDVLNNKQNLKKFHDLGKKIIYLTDKIA